MVAGVVRAGAVGDVLLKFSERKLRSGLVMRKIDGGCD